MKTLIEGGWVVAYNGRSHEVHERGSVVVEADKILHAGGLRGDWEGYARLVDDLGVRVYASPPFRDRETYMDARGRLTYEEDAAVGQARLREAVDFVRKYDGSAQGRLRGMLNAAQVETCSEPLLRAGKDAARELNVPIHT